MGVARCQNGDQFPVENGEICLGNLYVKIHGGLETHPRCSAVGSFVAPLKQYLDDSWWGVWYFATCVYIVHLLQMSGISYCLKRGERE